MRPSPKPPPEPSGLPVADALALVERAAARIWTPEGSDALAYLTGPKRGLTHETIRLVRLGSTPRAEGVPWQPPGIVIPWFDSSKLALVKIRAPDLWRERFPDDRRPPKYIEAFRDPTAVSFYPSPKAILPGRPLVVVEGEFDSLTLGEVLGEVASVVTLGSASSRIDDSLIGKLLCAPRWFIATDADRAGDKWAEKWNDFSRAQRVRPPSPYKDWTEARLDGINLARWWKDLIESRRLRRDARGDLAPELFSLDEYASRRWGSTIDDETPGIVIPNPHTPDSACEK